MGRAYAALLAGGLGGRLGAAAALLRQFRARRGPNELGYYRGEEKLR